MFSLYSVYVQCKSFAKLTCRHLQGSPHEAASHLDSFFTGHHIDVTSHPDVKKFMLDKRRLKLQVRESMCKDNEIQCGENMYTEK